MKCQWFRNCNNEATESRLGPVLEPSPHFGQVPCCERCAALADGNNT